MPPGLVNVSKAMARPASLTPVSSHASRSAQTSGGSSSSMPAQTSIRSSAPSLRKAPSRNCRTSSHDAARGVVEQHRGGAARSDRSRGRACAARRPPPRFRPSSASAGTGLSDIRTSPRTSRAFGHRRLRQRETYCPTLAGGIGAASVGIITPAGTGGCAGPNGLSRRAGAVPRSSGDSHGGAARLRLLASWRCAAAAVGRRIRRRGVGVRVGRVGRRRVDDFRRLVDQRPVAFAVGQPDIVDRVLDAVQAGAVGEHPAGENALESLVGVDFVDLGESVGLRRLGRRAGEADARRDLRASRTARSR